MMTLDEMKLAVCERLPELCLVEDKPSYWKAHTRLRLQRVVHGVRQIYWPTEGLQVCHEAEKVLSHSEGVPYRNYLSRSARANSPTRNERFATHSTYEQRLEALCRVWFPERFLK